MLRPTLLLALCLTLPGLAQSDPIVPGLPFPSGYPDPQPAVVTAGSITLSLELDGNTSDQQSGATRTTRTHFTAREVITLTGLRAQRSYSASGTSLMKVQGKDFSLSAQSTFQHSGSEPCGGDPKRPELGALGALSVSKKLKAAVCDFTTAMGPRWRIEDIPVHMVAESTQNGQTARTSNDTLGILDVRLPYRGLAGTPLSRQLNGLEDGGGDASGGIVEMAWNEGGGSGGFTVSVDALCASPGTADVDTPQAMARLHPEGSYERAFIIHGTLTVAWQLGPKPLKTRLVIAAQDAKAYDEWIPEPMFHQTVATPPLAVMASFKAESASGPTPRGRLDFYLRDVSRQEGECSNAPREARDEDDLRWAVAQPPGIVIDLQDPRHAYTKDPVEKAVVLVLATDGGAYGKVQAECKDLDQLAENERTGSRSLDLPKDENANHIADYWEELEGIRGENLAHDWDGAKVPGQSHDGDGLTLYEKYRGFRVLQGGAPAYVRLRARQKNLFVIDEGGIFAPELWRSATDIAAWRLDRTLVQGGDLRGPEARVVDFHGSRGKYCVWLETVQGLVEKDAPEGQAVDDMGAYGYTVNSTGGTPRSTDYCRVFPARIRAFLDRTLAAIDTATRHPESPEAKDLEAAGIPPWLAQRTLAAMNPAARDLVTRQIVTLTALHEMGHACGWLPDHFPKDAATTDPRCPMRYFSRADQRQIAVLQLLFRPDASLPQQYARFCQTCYPMLNVKD